MHPAVQPATHADLAAVRALLAAALLPVDDVDAALELDMRNQRGIGGLLGVVALQRAGDTALLRSLAVADAARGSGLGRVLLDAAETQARAAGIATLYLLTTTAADYFVQRGYTHHARDAAPAAIRSTAQFVGLCPASSAFMAKTLVPLPAAHATIWHNPACGTSRNTLALIRHAGVEPHIVDYLHTPPTRAELARTIARAGLRVRDAIRQKEPAYLELHLDDTSLGDDQLLDAMLRHPILINRPFVETDRGVRLCRPSELVLDLLPPVHAPFAKEDGDVVIDASGRRPTPRTPANHP